MRTALSLSSSPPTAAVAKLAHVLVVGVFFRHFVAVSILTTMVASLHIRHAKCLRGQHLIIQPTHARTDNIERALSGIRRSNENPSDVADIHICRTSFDRRFSSNENSPASTHILRPRNSGFTRMKQTRVRPLQRRCLAAFSSLGRRRTTVCHELSTSLKCTSVLRWSSRSCAPEQPRQDIQFDCS